MKNQFNEECKNEGGTPEVKTEGQGRNKKITATCTYPCPTPNPLQKAVEVNELLERIKRLEIRQ